MKGNWLPIEELTSSELLDTAMVIEQYAEASGSDCKRIYLRRVKKLRDLAERPPTTYHYIYTSEELDNVEHRWADYNDEIITHEWRHWKGVIDVLLTMARRCKLLD